MAALAYDAVASPLSMPAITEDDTDPDLGYTGHRSMLSEPATLDVCHAPIA